MSGVAQGVGAATLLLGVGSVRRQGGPVWGGVAAHGAEGHGLGAGAPKRHARADQLVPSPHPRRVDGRQDRHGAVRISQAVLRPLPPCEVGLKLAGDVGAGEVLVAEHVDHRLFVLLRHDRPVEERRVPRSHRRRPAVQRQQLAIIGGLWGGSRCSRPWSQRGVDGGQAPGARGGAHLVGKA